MRKKEKKARRVVNVFSVGTVISTYLYGMAMILGGISINYAILIILAYVLGIPMGFIIYDIFKVYNESHEKKNL